jgi:hypothetical protein
MSNPSILTHNGTITIHNPATGGHRTFRIRTILRGKLKGKRVWELLVGPDNDRDFMPIGFVDDGKATIWRKHEQRGDYQAFFEYKTFSILLERQQEYEARGIRYEWAACCCRCNRTLTTPESIRDGIGPECAKRRREKRDGRRPIL